MADQTQDVPPPPPTAPLPSPAASAATSGQAALLDEDPDATRIIGEEESCLTRVLGHVQRQAGTTERRLIDYDRQLIDLRDQIAQARLEDVPPLLEQMERLQYLAARQGQSTAGQINPRSPYFGRMVLREGGRDREVLIGRSTYLDTRAGLRIVDWRDAPVSRLFYRYAEGDDYEETFGERQVEGEVMVRRSVTIVEAGLRRITCPQGVFVRPESGHWQRGGAGLKLHGGQGSALRPAHHGRPGKLGVGAGDAATGEDRHLKAITALIDPRQFELITKPDSGLVVIQGGAGSGKTTIGLHRLAYLAFQDRRRFRPDRMLVIAFNQALVRYISQVLPALDVNGVGVRTYTEWASRLRQSHFARLTSQHAEDTPAVVTRLKKHPVMLQAIDAHTDKLRQELERALLAPLSGAEDLSRQLRERWRGAAKRPVAHQLHHVDRWIEGAPLSGPQRNALERVVRRGLERAGDVVGAWAELITDRAALAKAFSNGAPRAFTLVELHQAHEWCASRSALVVADYEREAEPSESGESVEEPAEDLSEAASIAPAPTSTDDDDDDGAEDPLQISDPAEPALLDPEDDTLLLRLHQRLMGPLLRPNGHEALTYEHILIDEAQDLSPVELAVVAETVTGGQSMTLAGDVAQRLYMDNGFTGWKDLLGSLGLSHVQVEPLRVTYRSTQQVMEVAQSVLGPLATEPTPQATRTGAPVDLFRFAHTGDAVGFLAEALRDLVADEPQASIAVIARYPEQADLYHEGLRQAELPNLRRIAEQDFPFKAGIDVTDIRQVKGLEFDYVVLVEANQATYGADDEARHLLHIAMTRAAHQLWLLATGTPSELLPSALRERAY